MSPIVKYGDVRGSSEGFHFEHVELANGARLGSTCWPMSIEHRHEQRRGIGIIIGEAPSEPSIDAKRPGEPLTHSSRVGKRLMQLLNVDTVRYYSIFDRMNLLPEQPRNTSSGWIGSSGGYKFDVLAAEKSAREVIDDILIPRAYSSVLILGTRVNEIITRMVPERSHPDPGWLQVWRSGAVPGSFMAVPHPSGTSRFWNDPEAVAKVRDAMRAELARMLE
jgi:hypothetical protein